MLSGKEINDLLLTLQRLYSHFAGITLHRRTRSYQKHRKDLQRYDLGEPLSTKIKTLDAKRSKDPGVILSEAPVGLSQTTSLSLRNMDERIGYKRVVILQTFNGLSEHFNKTRPDVSLRPEVGEKLRKSTWEHIHAAMRLAREGKVSRAMIHAEIANSALKEAARFMPETTYLQFIEEVKAGFATAQREN